MDFNYYSFILNGEERIFYTYVTLDKEEILDWALRYNFIKKSDVENCSNISDNKKKKYKLSCNIFPESVNKYISDNIIRKLNEVYLLYKTAKSHKDERLHRYEKLYRENISFIYSLVSDLENTAKDYKRADEYQREKIKLSIISNNGIVQYIDGIVKEAREIET